MKFKVFCFPVFLSPVLPGTQPCKTFDTFLNYTKAPLAEQFWTLVGSSSSPSSRQLQQLNQHNPRGRALQQHEPASSKGGGNSKLALPGELCISTWGLREIRIDTPDICHNCILRAGMPTEMNAEVQTEILFQNILISGLLSLSRSHWHNGLSCSRHVFLTWRLELLWMFLSGCSPGLQLNKPKS